MNKLINVTFLLTYCSLIFWLSSRSSLPTPMFFEHQDKIHHLGAYFIMGILTWRLFSEYYSKPNLIILFSLSYCSFYGISDEWHQSWVPGREADVLDWIADTVGASIALIMLYQINMRKNKSLI